MPTPPPFHYAAAILRHLHYYAGTPMMSCRRAIRRCPPRHCHAAAILRRRYAAC